MNIFEIIISKINRFKIKKLNAGSNLHQSVSNEKTSITISDVRKLLQDKKTFNEFLDKKKNQKYFSEHLGFAEYSQAINEYVRYFIRKNVILDKDEIKRAEIITGEKYKNNKLKEKNQYDYEEIIAQLLYMPNEYNYKKGKNEFNSLIDFVTFMNNPQEFHSNNILREVCGHLVIDKQFRNALLSSISDFEAQAKVLKLDDDIRKQIESLKDEIEQNNEGDTTIKVKEKFNSEKYWLNPEFEKNIMDKIPKNIKDKGKLAFEIYKIVFSALEYDTGYFIKKVDEQSRKYINKIMSKEVSELNEKNNKVVCSTATELYCYILSKFGIESNIVRAKHVLKDDSQNSHWSAEVILDNDIIIADATNGILDQNYNNMTDMTRLQLGLNPENFVSKKGYKYSEKVNEDALGYALQKDVDFIIKMMEEQGLDKSIKDITISEKLDILQNQLKKFKDKDVGNHTVVQYMKNIFSRLFYKERTKDILGISASLYTKKDEDTYLYFPIIYLKQSNQEYSYYCYDKEEGLKQISKKLILEMLQNEELFNIKGKENHIPGINKEDSQVSVENKIIENNLENERDEF